MVLAGHGWIPPEQDTIKITTDRALNFAVNRGGGDGVARSVTALLAAWCKPYIGISNPLIAEAYSLRDDVKKNCQAARFFTCGHGG